VAVLGRERGQQFCEVYDITTGGNFEGKNIPRLTSSVDEFARQRQLDVTTLQSQLTADLVTLRAVRDQRVHPGTDDKVLMDWNALAIEALASAGAVLEEPRFIAAAKQAANFIWTKMRRDDGRFYHAYRRGHAHLDAFQDDLADFANAALALFRATGQADWVEIASSVATQMIKHFEDPQAGGFFYTADDTELVIARQKDWHDSSVRSGNAGAAMALVELATLTGDSAFADAARRTFAAGSAVIRDQSAAAAFLLAALDRFHRTDQQTVIAAADWEAARDLRQAYFGQYRPHTALSWAIDTKAATDSLIALNAAKEPIAGQPTVYICQGFHCEAPLTGDAAMAALQRTHRS
ncbi:MAG: thioredoxin domain-containing protein, partial [Planctomycetaceae bacterium]